MIAAATQPKSIEIECCPNQSLDHGQVKAQIRNASDCVARANKARAEKAVRLGALLFQSHHELGHPSPAATARWAGIHHQTAANAVRLYHSCGKPDGHLDEKKYLERANATLAANPNAKVDKHGRPSPTAIAKHDRLHQPPKSRQTRQARALAKFSTPNSNPTTPAPPPARRRSPEVCTHLVSETDDRVVGGAGVGAVGTQLTWDDLLNAPIAALHDEIKALLAKHPSPEQLRQAAKAIDLAHDRIHAIAA